MDAGFDPGPRSGTAVAGPEPRTRLALFAFQPKRLLQLGPAAVLSLLFRSQFHGIRLKQDEEERRALPSAQRLHSRRGDHGIGLYQRTEVSRGP
jgi:hypothetical protein